MKYFFYFITILLSFTIGITELYLSHIGLGDPIRYDSNYIYGFSPKENQKKQRIKKSTVTINDAGLRSQINWKDNKKNKIVFLGDSITYGGSYIDDKETFSHLVCKKNNKFICGNAGVNAYSVINIVMRSRYDYRFNESQKFVFLLAPGDFYREYIGANSLHFYLNKKKFLFPAITEAINFVSTKYDLNNYISKFDDTNKVDQNKKDLIDFSIDLLDEEIKRLQNENKEVFLFYTIEKLDKKSRKPINRYILNKIESLKFKNFINLEEVLNNDKYFYDSVHYNSLGHEEVAKKISSIINID